jgi:hypothetical protein
MVVVLFVLVLVIFSFAQADSKKMVKMYSASPTSSQARALGQLTAQSHVAHLKISKN